jgi:glucosylceramidase
MCLDVQGGSPAPGTKLQIYPCNGTPAQKWTPPAKDYQGAYVSGLGANVCLDSAGGAAGARAQISQCSGTSAQQWAFKSLY